MEPAHDDARFGTCQHIKCAAFELPIESDETFGSENLVEILSFLETKGFVHKAGESWQRERSRLRERYARPWGVGRPKLPRRDRLAAQRVVAVDALTPQQS